MQTSPFEALPSAHDIAHYFTTKTNRRHDCEGISLWRDGQDYCYLWVEATVDHDYQMYYLLDIRTSLAGLESRDYLYVAEGPDEPVRYERHNDPVYFSAPVPEHFRRNKRGLLWFVEHVTDGSAREE